MKVAESHIITMFSLNITIHLFAMMESQEIWLKFNFAMGLSIQARSCGLSAAYT